MGVKVVLRMPPAEGRRWRRLNWILHAIHRASALNAKTPHKTQKQKSGFVPPQAEFPAVATSFVPFLPLCALSSFHLFSPVVSFVRRPSASAARWSSSSSSLLLIESPSSRTYATCFLSLFFRSRCSLFISSMRFASPWQSRVTICIPGRFCSMKLFSIGRSFALGR